MGQYIIKRFLFIVPFTLIVVFVTLVLNQYFSNETINLESLAKNGDYSFIDAVGKNNCNRRIALHQDWPIFYVTIQSAAIPAGLSKICAENERQFIKMLCYHSGNHKASFQFYDSVKKLDSFDKNIDVDILLNANSLIELKTLIEKLELSTVLKTQLEEIEESDSELNVLIPKIYFHGSKNQFHYWMKQAIKLDFGKSSINNLPVISVVNNALMRTLIFTIPAVIILFILSIGIGILISFSNKSVSKVVLNFLFFIDAIPLFWLSILLIIVSGSSFSYTYNLIGIENSTSYISQYALPIIALVTASLPYLCKQVYSSLGQVLKQPFVQAAFAKGISNNKIISNHILPNALVPIVVLFFNYLAFAFGGAFVIEMIFSISGIGKLMADSILSNDFQVVSLILLYLVVIKMVMMIFSDFVNYLINPILKFE